MDIAESSKTRRLGKLAKEFNVGIATIVEFLNKKGFAIDSNLNSKISDQAYELLIEEYSTDLSIKKESKELGLKVSKMKKETISVDDFKEEEEIEEPDEEILIKDIRSHQDIKTKIAEPKEDKIELKVVGKIPVETLGKKTRKKEAPQTEEKETIIIEKPADDKENVSEQYVKLTKIKKKPEPDKPEVIEKTKKTIESQKTVEQPQYIKTEPPKPEDIKVIGKIDLDSLNQLTRPPKKSKKEKEEERKIKEKEKKALKSGKEKIEKIKKGKTEKKEDPVQTEIIEKIQKDIKIPEKDFLKTEVEKLSGPTVVGKIDLSSFEDRKKYESLDLDKDRPKKKKKKRKRIKKEKLKFTEAWDLEDKEKKGVKKIQKHKKRHFKVEISNQEVDRQIKDTYARITTKAKSKGAKYRKEKREAISQRTQQELEQKALEKNKIKITEFLTVNELASFMNVEVNEVISQCMNLDLLVSINQRLDAEIISLIASEFGFEVEFVSFELHDLIKIEEDKIEDLVLRPPIVTVMGHVDHGKTKLLDYIRNTNVVAGEAGGITQHIGAYSVVLNNGRQITFLDTPGHEAFTAMRARGAQITDIVIVVVAADDGIMPQTVEAINHAQAAGVPIIFAINKIDKPTANTQRIKEELATMNILIDEWGGKYKSQEISAKQGINIDLLLEKVLLEADSKQLKANPDKRALGTVIESMLDKGKGYVSTIMVQGGTLKIGDIVLAGSYTGHIKAMYNERNQKIIQATPSTPVQIIGLNGAPQAGDQFYAMDNDKEAREIATKREQLLREQGLRTKKHITLEEIGRRIAIGSFKELAIIVKGDADGSIEALSDALIKLSTPELQVNIIHKAIGQISESDVMLATASNAIIVGFQVRPSINARKLAEREEIDIRLYSIIYDAINELKDAMEGMLSPEIKEEILATLEVKNTFKITKVGTIAGCFVTDGKITKNAKIRLIRDGIVIYSGLIFSLKRFKDEVREVLSGLECGLGIEKFNDIKIGDIIEAYHEISIKKKL